MQVKNAIVFATPALAHPVVAAPYKLCLPGWEVKETQATIVS